MNSKLLLLATNKFYKLASSDEDFYEDVEEGEDLQSFLMEVISILKEPDLKTFGRKTFLISLFNRINEYRVKEDKLSWNDFAKNLFKLNEEGLIVLSRADLVPAMGADLVESSRIQNEYSGEIHFIELLE